MKRNLLITAVALILISMTGLVLADGISLIVGQPYPAGRTEGGLYGQKKGGWEMGAAYQRHWFDSVDVSLEGAYRELPNAVDLSWMSDLKILELSANLKVRTNNQFKVVPYALLGLGVAEVNIEVDSAEARASLSSTEVLMKLGGGIDYQAAKNWAIYAEAFAWNSKYISLMPARLGVRLTL